MKYKGKYIIFKDNPIGAITDYKQDVNLKEKKENYKQFSYGKATMQYFWFIFERPKQLHQRQVLNVEVFIYYFWL